MRFALLPLTLLLLPGCADTRGDTGPAESAPPADGAVVEIDAVVNAVYDGFSFERGERPDLDALRGRFTPGARLMFVAEDGLVVRSVDEYLAGFSEAVEGGGLEMLREREITGVTEAFGAVAHRMSSYAVYADTTDAVAERGMISFQLVRTGGEWRVQSMLWDKETDRRRLPEAYDR